MTFIWKLILAQSNVFLLLCARQEICFTSWSDLVYFHSDLYKLDIMIPIFTGGKEAKSYLLKNTASQNL